MPVRHHGGPDALGVPAWDFSTNANACGPAPSVWRAVQQADATRYPDPASTALREALAAFHGVPASRIVVGVSVSELIMRMTAAVARWSPSASVFVPQPAYSDYAHAARAHGLVLQSDPLQAQLVWHTLPSSPQGRVEPVPVMSNHAVAVLDCAYLPLCWDHRLGPATLPPSAWQFWSPNKATGLTGVRAAYAIAPGGSEELQALMEAMAPSWPLGAHGVALLQAWVEPVAQEWLRASLGTLRGWHAMQQARCESMGWTCQPSSTPFFVARCTAGDAAPWPDMLARLRARGVKLRDTASMGLPGWVRLSVQPPAAQQALARAWNGVLSESPQGGLRPQPERMAP